MGAGGEAVASAATETADVGPAAAEVAALEEGEAGASGAGVADVGAAAATDSGPAVVEDTGGAEIAEVGASSKEGTAWDEERGAVA